MISRPEGFSAFARREQVGRRELRELIDSKVIEEIKTRCPAYDVISEYVTLKRAGANYVGLCPFHSEKSPSFTVFPASDSFYCFGCRAGGDVITFIRRAENLDYPSALEYLAKRAGITLVQSRDEQESARRRERTLEMNREAARYFHRTLLETPEGKSGLDYLLSRGLTMPTIRHFGLGFAPNDFAALPKFLSSKGFSDAEMSSAYLAGISKKSGRPYGLFRNRVIFPILSVTGDVIAFGGRVMDDSKPKYLNSSDTPAFKKNRNLFALNFAKHSCGEQMILCEGYMDVIALHAGGFTNAVATLGTAITPEQARIFSRYTKSVLICYDADEAGQNAASKAFKLLGEVGLECRILKVKNAKDPDEYLRKYGPDAFRKLMEGSKSEFDFRYDAVKGRHNLDDSDEKFRALDEVTALIAEIGSAAKRDLLIYRVAADFGVSSDSLKRDVDKLASRQTRRAVREEQTQLIRKSGGVGDRINPDYVKNPKAAAAEEAILGILLLHPEYLRELKNQGNLPDPSDFCTAFGRKVYEKMLELDGSGSFDESTLGQFFDVEEINRITRMRLDRSRLADNSPQLLLSFRQTLTDAARRDSLSLEELLEKKRKQAKKA